MALGEVVAFDSFEAPDRLAGEPAHLGDLATDGHRFLRQALANGFADLTGEEDSICAARSASASICSRARSSVAWTSLASTRPSAAAARRSFARWIAPSSMNER